MRFVRNGAGNVWETPTYMLPRTTTTGR
jgi:hypothetical protein